jgi:hypothetical protein
MVSMRESFQGYLSPGRRFPSIKAGASSKTAQYESCPRCGLHSKRFAPARVMPGQWTRKLFGSNVISVDAANPDYTND